MASAPRKIKDSDIDKKLSKLLAWNINTKRTEISKTFTFPSFVHAFSFVAKIIVHSEVLHHHPVVELSYGKVKVKLTTTEAKGLTNSDFELAKKIDNLKIV